MNDRSRVLVGERLGGMFPGFITSQSTSLLKLTAMFTEISKCCPAYVGKQLLFGAKRSDEMSRLALFRSIQVMHSLIPWRFTLLRYKELMWIGQSNQRFYAYNYFGQHPERLINWFDQHLGH